MTQPTFQVEGLGKLARQLKAFDEGAADLKVANKLAAEYVLNKALARIPVRTGRLKGSLRAAGQARASVVREGSKAVPYAGPTEFGGYPAGVPFVKEGKYLFPAAKQATEAVKAIYQVEVDKLVHKYF